MTYDLETSDLIFTMSEDEAYTMYHSGQCAKDVREVVGSVDISSLARKHCREAIRCTGAHDDDEIDVMSDEELVDFVAWIAAGNIVESIDSDDEYGFAIELNGGRYETTVSAY